MHSYDLTTVAAGDGVLLDHNNEKHDIKLLTTITESF